MAMPLLAPRSVATRRPIDNEHAVLGEPGEPILRADLDFDERCNEPIALDSRLLRLGHVAPRCRNRSYPTTPIKSFEQLFAQFPADSAPGHNPRPTYSPHNTPNTP